MTTTPEPTKGVPRHDGNSSLTLRADHNSLADWVRDNVGRSVANVAALPASGNWVGRTIFVTSIGALAVWNGSAWSRTLIQVSDVVNILGSALTATGNTGTTAYWGTATISFGTTFTAPPAVTVNVQTTGAVAFTQILSVSTTGVTFRVTRIAAVPGNLDYRWTATGTPA